MRIEYVLSNASSRTGLNPIKLGITYNPRRPDLTASAFNRLGQYASSPGNRP